MKRKLAKGHHRVLDPIHETPREVTCRAVAIPTEAASTRSQEILLTKLIQK
mgnify:CR=1 FL=1